MIDLMMVGDFEWKYWMMLLGKLVFWKVLFICFVMVGVWGDGLRMIEFLVSSVGIRVLMRIRYGYY